MRGQLHGEIFEGLVVAHKLAHVQFSARKIAARCTLSIMPKFRRQFLFATITIAAILPSISAAQSAKPTMKAIVVYDYGGPEALKLEDLPIPTPKQDETLIRVFAAGVNSFAGVLRSGKYAKIFKMQLPWIPGYDIAGIVEKVGEKVGKFKAGDPVYAFISIPR